MSSATPVSSIATQSRVPEVQRDSEDLGPVDLLVLEFPDRTAAADSLPGFVDVVDRGLIRVLDLVVLRKEPDGQVTQVDLADVEKHGEPRLVDFDGARSGLLGDEDIDAVAQMMAAGSLAALVIYENRWAEPLLTGLRYAGARVLDSERIPVDSVLAALDELDAKL
ncbi:MAG: DUF1269 domain-containing protein [Chloroflexi bacterium]|nr:DUF1269 domain-containing protein [Chloroflexota bacterium]